MNRQMVLLEQADITYHEMTEDSMNWTQDDSGWDHLPIEITMIIFKQLDIKSLINCFFVNNRFWDIAEYTAQNCGLWQEIVEHGMINRGSTFITKSKLKWRELFINSLLWLHVGKADISHLHTYKIAFTKYDKVHVYRDNLILVSYNKSVKYYNVENFSLTKILQEKCMDFEENDHLIAIVIDDRFDKKITLFGKINPDDFNLDDKNAVYMNNIKMYKLHNNHCFVIVEKNVVFDFEWHNSTWTKNFVARYYGCEESLQTMHVFDGKLYITLRRGLVLEANASLNLLSTVVNLNVPKHRTDRTIKTMFHRYSAVVEVVPTELYDTVQKDPYLKPFYITRRGDSEPIALVLKCPNLSCATEHGEVLFLGYKDGKVKIYVLANSIRWKSCDWKRVVREIDVKDLDKDIKDTRILHLNVYEAEGAHHLFITTYSRLFQVLITYTDIEKILLKK